MAEILILSDRSFMQMLR